MSRWETPVPGEDSPQAMPATAAGIASVTGTASGATWPTWRRTRAGQDPAAAWRASRRNGRG